MAQWRHIMRTSTSPLTFGTEQWHTSYSTTGTLSFHDKFWFFRPLYFRIKSPAKSNRQTDGQCAYCGLSEWPHNKMRRINNATMSDWKAYDSIRQSVTDSWSVVLSLRLQNNGTGTEQFSDDISIFSRLNLRPWSAKELRLIYVKSTSKENCRLCTKD